MGQGTQPLDRVSLGRGRKCIARPRGGAARHGARLDLSQQHAGDYRAPGAERSRADRVHAGDRPGRPRACAEPGASGRQSHRLHQLRVLDRNQMAGGAQADGAARHAGRPCLQPAERAVRRPIPAAGRGRGTLLLSGSDPGRRARPRRCRSPVRRARARTKMEVS